MPVRIVPYAPGWAADFARLNYDWIERYFAVEAEDRKVLEHPEATILAPGGAIFFAQLDGRNVGTVALIVHGPPGWLELGKMGVEPGHQGQGIGRALLQASLEEARQRGAQGIYLETHDSLGPARHLYRALGFVEVPMQPSPYARANVRMELPLDTVTT